jgi:HSP20 family protein
MDRLFERMFEDMPRYQREWSPASSFPAVNVWEDEKNLYAEAEIPGIRMEDLDVSVIENELILKGERKVTADEKATFHRRERGVGTFSRVFRLPVDIDADRVEATLRDGVLQITLPKAEAAKPRKVEVKALPK